MKRYFLFFFILIGHSITVFAQRKVGLIDTVSWRSPDPVHGWNLILPEDFENINTIVNYRREEIIANRVKEIIGLTGWHWWVKDTGFLFFNKKGLVTSEIDNHIAIELKYRLGVIEDTTRDIRNRSTRNKESYKKKYKYDSEGWIIRIVNYHDYGDTFDDTTESEYYYDISYNKDGRIDKVIVSSPFSKTVVNIQFNYDSHGKAKELVAANGVAILYKIRYYNAYDEEKGSLLLRRYYFNDSLIKEEHFVDSDYTMKKIYTHLMYEENVGIGSLRLNDNEKIGLYYGNSHYVYERQYFNDDGDEISDYDDDQNRIHTYTYLAKHLCLLNEYKEKDGTLITVEARYIYKYW